MELIGGIISIIRGVLGLRKDVKDLRGARGAGRRREGTGEDETVALSGLTARPVMRAEGFVDREEELTRLGQLIAEGKRVIWVTGEAQAGKSWLVCRHLRDQGFTEERAARFELRRGVGLQSVLEGVNSFLHARGCTDFDAACRSADLEVIDRIGPLVSTLNKRDWVIVLDSYEQVGSGSGLDVMIKEMQESLEGCVVIVGSRETPEWADASAHIEVGPIEEAYGRALLREAGAPEKHVADLYSAVRGLPGALEVAGPLTVDKSAEAVMRLAEAADGELGSTLLEAVFDVASEGAKRLWAGLCLLPAPVTRETAEALCEQEDFDDAWSELVRRKLLDPGEERAELHPLARAIGEDRLSEIAGWEEDCGKRIARHYARFAEQRGEDRAAVEGELENVLEAARLAFRYREWEALWAMGYALDDPLEYAGRWTAREELLRLCAEGAAKARNQRERAIFTQNLGIALQQRGRLEEAEALHNQSLEIAREVGDRPGEARTRHALAMIAETRGRLEEATAECEECLRLYRELGMRREEAIALHMMGTLAQARGKPEEAEGYYNQSLEIEREVGDMPGQAKTLHQLGIIAQMRGKLEDAEGLYKESLEIEREVGNRPGEATSYWALALLAEKQGDVRLAVERTDRAWRMFEEMGFPEKKRAREQLERLRKRLGTAD